MSSMSVTPATHVQAVPQTTISRHAGLLKGARIRLNGTTRMSTTIQSRSSRGWHVRCNGLQYISTRIFSTLRRPNISTLSSLTQATTLTTARRHGSCRCLTTTARSRLSVPSRLRRMQKTISRMNLALNLTITSHGRMTVLMSFMDTAGAR